MPVTTIPNSATTNLRRKLSWANVETPETYAADNNHDRFTTETVGPPRRKARRPRLNTGARTRVGGMEVDEDEIDGNGDEMRNGGDEMQLDDDDGDIGALTRTDSTEVEVGGMQGVGYEMQDDVDDMQEDDDSEIEIEISSSTTATKKDMEEYQRMVMLRREAERERARAMEEEDEALARALAAEEEELVREMTAEEDEALARALAEEDAALEPTTSEEDNKEYVKFVRRGNRFAAIARAREERDKTIAATQKYEQLHKLLQQDQHERAEEEGTGTSVGINIDDLPETVADIPAFVAKLKARGFGEEKIKWVFEKIGWGGMEKMGVLPEVGKGGGKVREDWEVDQETIGMLEGSEEWREYQKKMDEQAGLNW